MEERKPETKQCARCPRLIPNESGRMYCDPCRRFVRSKPFTSRSVVGLGRIKRREKKP